MPINWKLLNLRTDLLLCIFNAQRFNRWEYYYKKGKRNLDKTGIKLTRRVKKHLKKPHFRKLIFKS